MSKIGFYIYVVENWCGDSCDTISAFSSFREANNYIKKYNYKFWRPIVRKVWFNKSIKK